MGYSSDPDRVDVIEVEGRYGELTVGTSAVEFKVQATALSTRQMITMQAKDNKIYWGYDASVTTTTGTELFKGQFIALPIGAGISIYLIANVANRKIAIGELA